MHEWGRARDAFLLEREYGAVFKGMDYGTRLTRFESWHHHFGFLDGLRGQESACKSGDPGLIPGTGRSLRGENGNPPQYSCLENPMDRGAWQTAVHGVAKSRTRLSAWWMDGPPTLLAMWPQAGLSLPLLMPQFPCLLEKEVARTSYIIWQRA